MQSEGWINRRSGGEDGQSLVLIVIAMGVVLILAALAIDLSSWYQRHHQAQVAADAAALAAANYMAHGGTATTATSTATTYASNYNGLAISNSNVTVDTTSSVVTVTVPTTGGGFFEHLFGSSGPHISAVAKATWNAPNAQYSLFAGNTQCGAGLGLDFVSNGGGNQNIYGIFSNGQFTIDSNSNQPINGAYSYDQTGGTACSGNTSSVKDGTIGNAGTTAIPYPETYTEPTNCQYSASYFTTDTSIGNGSSAVPVPSGNQIKGPGVYCVTSSFTGTCTNGYESTTNGGYIYVNAASLSGSYEFVGPCVTLSNITSSLTSPPNAPLVYGTSNIQTAAPTPSGLPTCTSNTSTATSTWLNTNGITLASPIYDQCGTVEIVNNNATFDGFVEAWNILVDKNNGVTGTGPSEPFLYGTDALLQ